MRNMLTRPFVLLALIALSAGPAMAQSGKLTVELNKFEIGEDDSCRAFFLFRNDTANSFEGFEMSLAVLDQSGIIDQLLTIDAAPLPTARTTLKLFEIPKTGCNNISEILLHEIATCLPQNGENIDCFPLIQLVSKTSAGLVK